MYSGHQGRSISQKFWCISYIGLKNLALQQNYKLQLQVHIIPEVLHRNRGAPDPDPAGYPVDLVDPVRIQHLRIRLDPASQDPAGSNISGSGVDPAVSKNSGSGAPLPRNNSAIVLGKR